MCSEQFKNFTCGQVTAAFSVAGISFGVVVNTTSAPTVHRLLQQRLRHPPPAARLHRPRSPPVHANDALHLAAAHLVRIGPGRGLGRALVQKSHAKPRPHARRTQKAVPQRARLLRLRLHGKLQRVLLAHERQHLCPDALQGRHHLGRRHGAGRLYSHIRPRTPAARLTAWPQGAPRRTRCMPAKSAAAARPASGGLPAATPRPAHGLPAAQQPGIAARAREPHGVHCSAR